MEKFIFVKSGICHDFYDNLLGTQSRFGRCPKYLKIIDYVLDTKKFAYSRKELMANSDYDMVGWELFASFNRNKILEYRREYPYRGQWIKGENFDLWRESYYPESLIKYPTNYTKEYKKQLISKKQRKINSLMSEIDKLKNEISLLNNK